MEVVKSLYYLFKKQEKNMDLKLAESQIIEFKYSYRDEYLKVLCTISSTEERK